LRRVIAFPFSVSYCLCGSNLLQLEDSEEDIDLQINKTDRLLQLEDSEEDADLQMNKTDHCIKV